MKNESNIKTNMTKTKILVCSRYEVSQTYTILDGDTLDFRACE